LLHCCRHQPPFKFFVFAAGVFEVPLWSYTSAITLARLIRYFGIGYLAVSLRQRRSAVPEGPQTRSQPS